jgi:hypothetical protein
LQFITTAYTNDYLKLGTNFMLNLIGKQSLMLRIAEETALKVEDKWCQAQQKDMITILQQIEDIIEKAVNSHSSSMSYQLFQQSKADFVEYFLDVASKYRRIQEGSKIHDPFKI